MFVRYIIFIATLVNSISAGAQSFLPFPSGANSILWKYHIQSNTISGTVQYMYNGADTLAGSNTYQKILTSYNYTVTPGMSGPYVVQAYDQHCCYVRQSEQGIIYFFQDGQEQIYFDLNIQTGDTIPPDWLSVSSSSLGIELIIQSIDTVYDNNSIPHRRYKTQSVGPASPAFIEGIGSIFDFKSLLPSNSGAPAFSLTCVSENGLKIYPSGQGACIGLNIPNDIEEHQNRNEWNIYPNPGTGLFTVSSAGILNYNIEVHNTTGQLLHTEKVQGSTTTIDLQNHAAGVYTITVTGGEQVMHSKIIKN